MHKGYTLNYFINFFSNIPNSEWTTGRNTPHQLNAAGHAFGYNAGGRLLALEAFLGSSNLSAINNGTRGYSVLGKSPRTRLVAALRLRQKYGPNWKSNI